jgi:hypothetical protein
MPCASTRPCGGPLTVSIRSAQFLRCLTAALQPVRLVISCLCSTVSVPVPPGICRGPRIARNGTCADAALIWAIARDHRDGHLHLRASLVVLSQRFIWCAVVPVENGCNANSCMLDGSMQQKKNLPCSFHLCPLGTLRHLRVHLRKHL